MLRGRVLELLSERVLQAALQERVESGAQRRRGGGPDDVGEGEVGPPREPVGDAQAGDLVVRGLVAEVGVEADLQLDPARAAATRLGGR